MHLKDVSEGLLMTLGREGVHIIDSTFLQFSPEDLGLSLGSGFTQRQRLIKEARIYSALEPLLDSGMITFPKETMNEFSYATETESAAALSYRRSIGYQKRKARALTPSWTSVGKFFASERDRIMQIKSHAKRGIKILKVMKRNATEKYIEPKVQDYVGGIIGAVKNIGMRERVIRDLQIGLTPDDPRYQFRWNDAIIYAKAMAVAFSGWPASILTRDPDFVNIHKRIEFGIQRLGLEFGFDVPKHYDLEVVFASRGRYVSCDREGRREEITGNSMCLLQQTA